MIMYWFLIIILVICSYASTSTSANSGGRVEYLPGFQGPLPFYLETGYVGVDENEDAQLFYYFIRSESNPDDDPLMLWITGGPGCSSISGLLYEIGPIQFEAVRYNGSLPTLISTPYSWTKMASIIFLDIPVGTGFSYARTKWASRSTDTLLSVHAHEFMRKWFESHPEFVSNAFYVGGDSYSGIPVPIITQLISDGNEAGNVPYINLKGYVLGNPATFPGEINYRILFANGMGLISEELYKSLFQTCRGEYRAEYVGTSNIGCRQNLDFYQECIDGIEEPHILEPYCGNPMLLIKLPTRKLLNDPLSSPSCRKDRTQQAYYWINEASVREALHIRKGSIREWIRCNPDLNFTRTVYDVRPYHLNLSNKGYRSLIYSGDHDMVIPHQSTQAWIKELNYSVIDRWRSWKLNGQIAGYTESYSNKMTFVTVKGGGHTAPEYKPRESVAMFKRNFTRGT
ncbi:putative peptidase S10, serine carboxypeptidase, alpha/Beta hydrolase [Helianthus annuus]|uniref:serine carboxypeptidase-like 13 isoform X2 n=1 Tax=Helianthus annuus TaxID=4232 RepID=UPI001652E7D6|nr:serine carboxypeptidase-like 13 isoform X2 [Helianthus annuus]KAJ0458171.1 putative peptidase S10, serine carboxypeptidase, alpha/Beta hydrolase [Helianthus annuus]